MVAGFRKVVANGLKSGDALDCHKWIAACGEQVGRSNSRLNESRGSRFWFCPKMEKNCQRQKRKPFLLHLTGFTRSLRLDHEPAPRMDLPKVTHMKAHSSVFTLQTLHSFSSVIWWVLSAVFLIIQRQNSSAALTPTSAQINQLCLSFILKQAEL